MRLNILLLLVCLAKKSIDPDFDRLPLVRGMARIVSVNRELMKLGFETFLGRER